MISVALQTHPLRAALAAQLAEAIGGDVELAVDPDPDGRPSPWRAYRNALELTPAGATHRLVIQDDAIVCRDFRETVTRAVAARPDRLITLFVGGLPREHRNRVLTACSRDEPWAELDNLRWCPAIALVWPVAMIGPLLDFYDKLPSARWTADDEIIGRYCKTTLRLPLATVPSLVEHPDDVPSLVGRRNAAGLDKARVAACFIHPDCDPLSIDWG